METIVEDVECFIKPLVIGDTSSISVFEKQNSSRHDGAVYNPIYSGGRDRSIVV
jgi:hypothetical protein